MDLKIEIDEIDLRGLVIQDLKRRLYNRPFEESKVSIEVKSKQNGNNENWGAGQFRATYTYVDR